jgi:hypothetical protein
LSFAPLACATRVATAIEKHTPIEINIIPRVRLPRPNPASSVSPILPQVPTLIIMYTGWKSIPTIGKRASLHILIRDSLMGGS